MASSKTKTKSGKQPVEELTYEQAFAELETIVSELETDNSSLEAVMALFERGQELARYCTRLLDQADLKIQQLSGGNLTEFEPLA
jgi:exodeoxyribonuclease VII small subunit